MLIVALVLYFIRVRNLTMKVSRQRRSVKKSPLDRMMSLRNYDAQDWQKNHSTQSPEKVVPYPVHDFSANEENSMLAGSVITLVKMQD